MKDQKEKRLSFREAFQINHRALLCVYKKYPFMITSSILRVIWQAITPYVGIYLSALIIGELAGNKDAGRLKELVVLTLVLEAAIALISALLEMWCNIQCSGRSFKIEQIFVEKLLDMDFVTVDDEKTQELLYLIRQNQNGGGWGFFRMIENCEALISSLCVLLGGIACTITLFTSVVSDGYAWLNQPIVLIGVVLLMIGLTYMAPVFSAKADSYWAINADRHREGNRKFSFFCGWMRYKGDLASDSRIYRQDMVADKYDCKTAVFGSKGIFAGYARGPMGIYSSLSAAISVMFIGVAYLFVCLKAWAGAFGIGEVTRYIASITKVSQGISSMIATVEGMRNNATFLKEIFTFLDLPNPMYQGSLTIEKRQDRDYEVEFLNVSFHYPGREEYVLKNINMKFRVGERLAVVGVNGSGKTTFIKLLCRLYDPTEGEIHLNGIDIRKYNYQEYMSIFSVVFQDFQMFAFPLGQNVAARLNYDRERVSECLEKAGFSERLKEFDEGIETYLYKDISKQGIDISGGEAQKIALARCLYKDAPFIVLDEPTAALDPVAEAEVYTRFNEFVGDKTAIYISHRLSSCRFCDEIAVFQDGEIVQQGSHEQLVEDKNGEYYALWNAQAQYYTRNNQREPENVFSSKKIVLEK